MANTNSPIGLLPLAQRNGAPYNGSFNVYAVPASDPTPLGIGDLVKLGTEAEVVNGRFLKDITRAETGDIFAGVVVGFGVDPNNLSLTYRTASTQREVYVADDPDLVFAAIEGATGTPLTLSAAGLNINILVGNVNTVTGYSTTVLDNTTEAASATLDLHLIAPENTPNNVIGYNCQWRVTINRHQFANQTLGA